VNDQATWELGNGAGATIDFRVRGVTIYNEDNIIALNERQLDRLLLLLQCLPGDGPSNVLRLQFELADSQSSGGTVDG
jgi:hypothetical protein